jgi:hypothetical protein
VSKQISRTELQEKWKDWQGTEEEGYQKWNDLPRIGMSIENGCWNPTLNSGWGGGELQEKLKDNALNIPKDPL